MPAYSYRCDRCHHSLDLKLPMGLAPDKVKCPECSAVMRRAYTVPQLSGFTPEDKGKVSQKSSKDISTQELRAKVDRHKAWKDR